MLPEFADCLVWCEKVQLKAPHNLASQIVRVQQPRYENRRIDDIRGLQLTLAYLFENFLVMLHQKGSSCGLVLRNARFSQLVKDLLCTKLPLKHLGRKGAPVYLRVLLHLSFQAGGDAYVHWFRLLLPLHGDYAHRCVFNDF